MKKNIKDFFERGQTIPLFLVASLLLGSLIAIDSLVKNSPETSSINMRIASEKKVLIPEEEFSVNIVVDASQPVNVFSGELTFNPELLSVSSITYNNAVADLWVEKPWYSNGAGVVHFAGGTTRQGGFTGSDTLITVTFLTRAEGTGVFTLQNTRILHHDGEGTDATLPAPLDVLFTVAPPTSEKEEVAEKARPVLYEVTKTAPSTDLNGDGTQSIADVSIFILNMGKEDSRFDFNRDGEVTAADLSILLGTY